MNNEFALLVAALMDGRSQEAERIWSEALNKSFEAGQDYAMDTVGDWHRPSGV
jgi:hypothetical protein